MKSEGKKASAKKSTNPLRNPEGRLHLDGTTMIVVGLKFMQKELQVFGDLVATGSSSSDRTIDFVRRMRAYLDVLEDLDA
jgi:hypothetical protein